MQKVTFKIVGLIFFIGFFFIIRELHVPYNHQIMLYVVNAIAMLLFFFHEPHPPEPSFERPSTNAYDDEFLERFAGAIYKIASRGTGALVILENSESLDHFANQAILLNAKFTPDLLESIFEHKSPLNVGAVIIRETTILSAATILPITREYLQEANTSMGTRQLAALRFSQITDALVIIVSEETKKVSIAKEGIMVQGVRIERFKGIIQSIFNPKEKLLS